MTRPCIPYFGEVQRLEEHLLGVCDSFLTEPGIHLSSRLYFPVVYILFLRFVLLLLFCCVCECVCRGHVHLSIGHRSGGQRLRTVLVPSSVFLGLYPEAGLTKRPGAHSLTGPALVSAS